MNNRTATVLGRRIIEGKYSEGDRMPSEHELVKEFDTGRNSIREAMQRLAAWGMVWVRPKHRTVVLPQQDWLNFDPSVMTLRLKYGDKEAAFRELSEIRLGVEPTAAYLAALKATTQDIEKMRLSIDGMRAASADTKKYSRFDADFHRAVLGATQNSFFCSFYLTLGILLEAGIASRHEPWISAPATEEHTAVLKAIEARDALGAKEAMLTHLVNAQRVHGWDNMSSLGGVDRT